MGYNFYQRQLDKFGTCAGYLGNPKRRRNMSWTDETKAEAVEAYVSADPTPENSMEIVKEIAESMGQSPNGVRMILTKAGVYVKKAPATGATKSSGSNGGSSRVSKAAAIEGLTAALMDAGADVDEEIVSKLTGKAAAYFAGIITKVNEA